MSTVAIIRQPGACHFITDGGSFHPETGALIERRSKVAAIGDKAVLVHRGIGGEWPELLAGALATLPTFDHVVLLLGKGMRELWRAHKLGEEAQAEIYVAGHSPTTGEVECFQTSTAAGFEVSRAPRLVIAPAPALDLRSVFGRGNAALEIEDLDPEADGLRIIEAQRVTPGAGGFLCAGFYAEHTRVDRDGITRAILREWPDLIGERVAA